jgi:hypothetical protein
MGPILKWNGKLNVPDALLRDPVVVLIGDYLQEKLATSVVYQHEHCTKK